MEDTYRLEITDCSDVIIKEGFVKVRELLCDLE